MPIVSVTRLRVRSWRYLPVFAIMAMRSAWQARNAEGSLGVKILSERKKAFWTSTCWESEEAMKRFMMAAPHGPTMRKLLDWCDEAALVHWKQEGVELPTWTEAHARLTREGRTSKVRNPSTDQTTFTVAAPPARARGEVRMK
ncbi:MAG TPA: DUF3291 domain-containing protein [Terracidiphilus sp.]|jgi:hypothetical protein|nr:DUF3291 domain-containing protein [Terracidiphilus sp.]